MGVSSLLPPLQEVYSQFQVLCLKCSQQREVESMHFSAKSSEKPFKNRYVQAFWLPTGLSEVSAWLVPPSLADHRGTVFVPPLSTSVNVLWLVLLASP